MFYRTNATYDCLQEKLKISIDEIQKQTTILHTLLFPIDHPSSSYESEATCTSDENFWWQILMLVTMTSSHLTVDTMTVVHSLSATKCWSNIPTAYPLTTSCSWRVPSLFIHHSSFSLFTLQSSSLKKATNKSAKRNAAPSPKAIHFQNNASFYSGFSLFPSLSF